MYVNSSTQSPTVAVIGGGSAGSTIAIRLAMAGIHVHLIEKNASLINAPPMCHLHAGGNLYREISDEDCRMLMRQCIDIAKLYPESIDVRPTLITVPKRDNSTATDLLPRLDMLTAYYQSLVDVDPSNQVLGKVQDYYRVYDKQQIQQLIQLEAKDIPSTTDEWVVAALKVMDLEKLQYPIIAVQEFGWNIFRLSASAFLQLQRLQTAQVHLNAQVDDLKRHMDGWQVSFTDEHGELQHIYADFVVNACGFRTGIIDDKAGVHIKRMVEFKASYIGEWRDYKGRLPEIIFHGERGTPNGMAQFTPYPDGFFQLHGMTENITLFNDGLTKATPESSQPPINPQYLSYIENGWEPNALKQRTQNAIDYVSEFVPSFRTAQAGDNALYGGQQVPSDDITVRVADLQVFAKLRYAVAENVKANSTLDVADKVMDALVDANLIEKSARKRPNWHKIDVNEVNIIARDIAKARQYPLSMAKVNQRLLV